MRSCRAPTPDPRSDRGRLLPAAFLVCGLTVGLLGPRLAAEAREVVADFAPDWFAADARAQDAAAAAALVEAGHGTAAPYSFPRHAEGLRVALDAARSPAAVAELTERLGILGDSSDVPRLEVLADSRLTQVRIAALGALGRLGSDRALDLLTTYVRSSDWELASHAIAALGKSDTDRALQELTILADHPQPGRRQAAWSALALRGGAGARAVLHRVARTCPSSESWSAMYAVAALGEPVDQRLLLAMARGGDTQKASSALNALSNFPATAITDALLDLARTAPSHRRNDALAALSGLDDPRAVEVLEEAARGRRHERNTAIHALGRSRAPGAFEALVGVADEAGPNEVQAAVSALAGRSEPEAREIVRDMAKEPSPLGPAALAALAGVDDPRTTELLVEAFDERGVLPPAHALNHLAVHGGEDGWSLLEEVLATGDAGTRNSVVWALQQRGGEDAVDRLLDLARTGDRNVASAALGSLEQMDEHARDGLRSLLIERVSEGADADYGQSLTTLARLGGDDVLELLETRLDQGTVTEKQQALGALAQMTDPAASAAIERIYRESEEPSMRVQALNQLLWSDDVGDDILDSAMADDDPSVVATVASMLAQRGGEDASARLVEMAEAEDAQVRTAAISSLAQIGGEGAEAALLAGLQDPDVAPSIMWSVSSSSSPVVKDALREVAREGDPAMRANALSALSMDADPGTTDILAAALADEDSTVATSALYALQSRGSSSAAEVIGAALDELPEDEDAYGMRQQAANALRAIGGPAARDRADLLDSILNPDEQDFGLGMYGRGYDMPYPID